MKLSEIAAKHAEESYVWCEELAEIPRTARLYFEAEDGHVYCDDGVYYMLQALGRKRYMTASSPPLGLQS